MLFPTGIDPRTWLCQQTGAERITRAGARFSGGLKARIVAQDKIPVQLFRSCWSLEGEILTFRWSFPVLERQISKPLPPSLGLPFKADPFPTRQRLSRLLSLDSARLSGEVGKAELALLDTMEWVHYLSAGSWSRFCVQFVEEFEGYYRAEPLMARPNGIPGAFLERILKILDHLETCEV